MKHSRGFTLIELIIVITILGILAAVALPRFVDVQRDARIAKLAAARGAIAAAMGIIHGGILPRAGQTIACPAGGNATNVLNGAGTACTENGLVATNMAYPSSVAIGTAPPGIHSAAGLTSMFNPTAADLNAEGYNVTVAGTVTTIQIFGAPTPGTCQFTYTHSTVLGVAPVVSATTTTGC